ncbi:MAG: TolC family protein, partial [Mucilaginibacter sp.]|nr:TolC family protein [Mucilaginibacter sp.]
MIRKSFLTLLWILPIFSHAQTSWTLKNCIEYGLKNNRSQVVYDNEKKAADAKAKEALSAYLPAISLDGEVDNNIKAQATVIPAGVFGPNDIKVAFTKKFNTTATAQLDQTLIDISMITGLKANRYNKEQAVLNQQKNDEAIIYNIISGYYQIYVYREQLNLLRANLETYRKQMDVAALKVKKGIALQKDLDKVKVDHNNAFSQVRVAESNKALAENQLKYDMGYPINNPLPIDTAAVQTTMNAELTNTSDTASFNPLNRVDYKLSEVNTKLLEIDEKRIKNGIYPKLTAFARYGGVGFSDRLGSSFGLSDYAVVGIR